MEPKSGSAVAAVAPTAPEEVFEADEASPGKIAEIKAEQIQTQSGKYGTTSLPAHKAAAEEETTSSSEDSQSDEQQEEETSFIEIKLVDEEGNPVPGEKYEVLLPDGTIAKGTLSNIGVAKIDNFKPGDCKVSFPNLCKDAWSKQ